MSEKIGGVEMQRLTKADTNQVCYDTWELCKLDNVCKRDCWEPTPCEIPAIVRKLAEYEDTGLTPEEVIKNREKQIPKKPFHHPWNGINGVPYDLCPSCETNLCTDGFFASKKEKYCGECGQRLDWKN